MPKDVNDGARIYSARSGISQGKMGSNRMSGTWYFSNFFFVIFHDFYVVLFPLHSFPSVSLLKKRQNACY